MSLIDGNPLEMTIHPYLQNALSHTRYAPCFQCSVFQLYLLVLCIFLYLTSVMLQLLNPFFNIPCLLQKHVKRPKYTKHLHEVLLKEGGSVFQKAVQLTLKHSAVTAQDDGYSTPSPSLQSVCIVIIIIITIIILISQFQGIWNHSIKHLRVGVQEIDIHIFYRVCL